MTSPRKTALITGAGTGVGAATALALARRGYDLLLNYSKSEREAREVEAACRELGAEALVVQGSVAEDADCRRLAAAASERWGGRLDALVNNAGISVFAGDAAWDVLDAATFQRIYGVNVLGSFQMVRACLPLLQAAGEAAIVNVSSVLGQVSAPTRGPYCVSKSALISLTKMQAIEWAERGIRVNAIAPGYIMNEPTRVLAAAGSFDPSAINKRTPMGRMGSEEEAAQGIAYLLSPEAARYVTGHTLEVNGGWTAYGYL